MTRENAIAVTTQHLRDTAGQSAIPREDPRPWWRRLLASLRCSPSTTIVKGSLRPGVQITGDLDW